MSLINDALKKAQKQRTGESPVLSSLPNVGGETPQRIARRAKPAGFETLMVRAGIGAVVLLVVIVGGYFAFRSDSDDRRQVADNSNPAGGPVSAPAVSQPSAGQTPGSQQGTTVPSSAVSQPSTISPQVSSPAIGQATAGGLSPQVSPATAPTFTLPVASGGPVSAPAAASPVGTSRPDNPPTAIRPASSTAGTPVTAAPALTGSDPRVSPFSPASVSRSENRGPAPGGQQPATVQPAPKLEPRAIQFIDNIKVAGIRASSTDAKVLMNDRVYRIGSLVDADLGLTLVEIAPNALTFEDQRGGRYTRTF